MAVFKEVEDTVMWPPMQDGKNVKSIMVTKGTGANGLGVFNVTVDSYDCAHNYGLIRESFSQVIDTIYRFHLTSGIQVIFNDVEW